MRVTIAASIAVVAMLPSAGAHAQESDDGYFDLVSETEEEGTPDGESEEPHWTNCAWHEVHVFGNNRTEDDGVRIFHIDAQRWKHDAVNGLFYRWGRYTCTWSTDPTRLRTTYGWELLTTPDPALGIDPAHDRVVERILAPVADLSPVGPGYVNLGMWLATQEPEENPVVARAATTNTWAEVTAVLATTTFDMGNGDVITCTGVGDPIPDWAVDSVEQSPECGYTFRDVDGDGAVTITATWTITYELSDGRTGSRPDVVLSTTVPYEVREIQTVGVGG